VPWLLWYAPASDTETGAREDRCDMGNNDTYREKQIERMQRQLRRSAVARELEKEQYGQRRINSAKIYSRKLKHLKNLLEE